MIRRRTAALAGAALAAVLAVPALAQQPGPGPGQDPAAAAAAAAAAAERNAMPDNPGTGPYAAMKEMDPSLPDHTVYRPADLDAMGDVRLGVYAWGNGGCSDDAASTRFHLLEIASHGYLAIASGQVYSGPGAIERPYDPPEQGAPPVSRTNAHQLIEAIDWALAENARPGSPYYGKIDPDMVAVSGFSCGGVQTLDVASDPRIATEVIMNSGLFNGDPPDLPGMDVGKEKLADIHFPIIYILGGPTDIAYENGMDDYSRINNVPIAVANEDTGHGGTYFEPNGGPAAQVAVHWLDWRLRGDQDARAWFVGEHCGLCEDPVWTYESKGLE